MNAIDRAVNGAAGVGLSKRQKMEICKIARQAWIRAGMPFFDPDAFAGADPIALSASQALELWRHEEQGKAMALTHLTAAGQRDFPVLMAHFHHLAGNISLAESWAERALTDPARQALSRLRREIDRARRTGAIENPESYVLAIARRQFKVAGIEQLSAKQAWALFYTMRNRINARGQRSEDRGQTDAGAGFSRRHGGTGKAGLTAAGYRRSSGGARA